MTEHAPSKPLGIDVSKTIAGVLAAISAAVVGSFLGVAGTLVGAAVASIVGSVGTELYQRGIGKSSEKIKSTFVTAPAAVGTPEVAAAADEVPSEPEPSGDRPVKVRWGRISMVAAGVFLLAMLSLTAFELITGKTAADAVTNQPGSGTTVSNVLTGRGDGTTTPAPSQSASPSATPDDEAPATTPATTDPTATPTDTDTVNPTPAGGNTDATTAPTDTETTEPPADQDQTQGPAIAPDSGDQQPAE